MKANIVTQDLLPGESFAELAIPETGVQSFD
jgi:hypothetical protein